MDDIWSLNGPLSTSLIGPPQGTYDLTNKEIGVKLLDTNTHLNHVRATKISEVAHYFLSPHIILTSAGRSMLL